MPQQGHLIIADISGYTAFLTQAELDHAEDIMSSLFDTLLKHMRSPLVISKLEGDAVVQKIIESDLATGKIVMEGDWRLEIGD